MTEFIGMISQKGGVGKSTLARLIAREYAAAQWDVKIADLDTSQGTSTEWKLRREENDLRYAVAVEPYRNVAQALKHADSFDLMVFDGPPHSMSGTLEIAKTSKLVVLPTGLSLDDLRPTIRLAHELVDKGISDEQIAFTLCRVGDRDNEIEEARTYIEKAGYLVIQGSIPEKTAYRRASDEGKAVSEVSYLSLRKRAEEVAQGIINLMAKESE
ncbi:MAG: ParA family protein [Cyanobacteria bacterium J06642_2]